MFTVGDVSDKGIPAALFMSMTMTTLRLSLRQGLPLEEVMYHINNTLAERNPNMMFVTLFVVKVDARSRHCEAANAGHCFPIVYNNDTLYELDTVSGPAIGAIEDVHYEKYSFDLKSGDSFIIYSDGISEAQNSKAEFFSVEHILKTVREHEKLMPQDMLDAINKEIDSFRGTAYQSDDITALCFKLK
ncbi:PP2C family protein-serine/threonine phosphatase [Anaerobiospirillum thomasii]|uniref:PP2C family protein-serine/threonine phosphatase n=1 Tax=Anaerobiospirillum thomasii TaxID=179995 RepID=UPI0024821ACE|nr:PP2C family protein-serine/threonine phosphatase [Anaerobiospirillum thomasii]